MELGIETCGEGVFFVPETALRVETVGGIKNVACSGLSMSVEERFRPGTRLSSAPSEFGGGSREVEDASGDIGRSQRCLFGRPKHSQCEATNVTNWLPIMIVGL